MKPGVSEHKAYILSTFESGQKKGGLPFPALILALQGLLVLAVFSPCSSYLQ